MKVFAATSPDTFAFDEIAVPKPSDYEVLVRHEGCLICNSTDWMIVSSLYATPGYPVVLGHESFGKVVEVGAKVRNFRLGDRVICSNAIPTGYNGSYYSTWGGFAEYGIGGDYEALLADGASVSGPYAYRRRYRANYKIDANLSVEEAGLIFPLSETASCILQVPEIVGKEVAVFGTGTAGYTVAMFLKQRGAKTVAVFGRRESRAQLALTFGADFAGRTDQAYESGRQYDVVFEVTGNSKVFARGLPFLREGGILAVYGVSPYPYELDLARSPGSFEIRRVSPQVGSALEEVQQLMRAGKIPVSAILSHIWNFQDAEKAFRQVKAGEVIKGLVRISQ